MANVKITDLTELAAVDIATNDVLPIVDINTDTTKKVTISSLSTGVADANDFVTFTRLNANINTVQDNVAATEARRVANTTAFTAEDTALQARITANAATAASNDFITFTRLNANINTVQDNVASLSVSLTVGADSGSDDTVTVGTDTLNFVGQDGITTTVSDNQIAIDLDDTAVTAGVYGGKIGAVSNVPVITIDAQGRITSAANSEVAVDLTTLEGNVNTVSSNVAAVEARRAANVTIHNTEDTALQARLTTNVNSLTTSINTLDANADAIEARRVANVTVHNTEDTALQARITANAATAASNDFITFTRLNANINLVQDNVASVTVGTASDTETRLNANLDVVQDNVAAVESRRTANIAGGVSTITTSDLTASRALVSSGSGKVAVSAVTATELGHLDGVTSAIQTQLDAKSTTSNATALAAEDVALQSRLATNVTAFTNEDTALQARITANNTLTTAVETRRTQNIAGAVSTITTSDLTASRAMVTNGSGKVAVSDVTATELGYLDGVTSAIQTQIDSKQATITGAATTIDDADLTASRALVSSGSGKVAVSAVTSTELGYLDGVSSAIQTQLDAKAALAGATFTGQVNMSDDLVVTGNLTVNGVTTTVSSTNLDVEDRLIMLADGATGSPSADVGLLFNRGNQGNAAIFYDESAKTFKLSDTKDPKSNTSLSPVTASNLDVGILTASTVKFDGADLNTAISDNVSTLNTSITALETRRTNNIAGAISTVTTSDLTASRALVSSGSGKVAVSAVTSTELGYLDGVSSAIQTQLDAKQATITGAATTIDDADLTASRALVSSGSGKVAVSAVTSTELGYLDGVTSAIQTQLDAKAALSGATFTGAVRLNAANLEFETGGKVAKLVPTSDVDPVLILPASTGTIALTSQVAIETNKVETRRAANIAGAVSTITTSDLTASRAMVTNGSGKVAVSAVTATELGYLDGVSSAIQTQLDAKQATITGAATTIDDADLTASRALVSSGSGKVAVSAVTSTELGYLDGVTSAIQTQLDAKLASAGANNFTDNVTITSTSAGGENNPEFALIRNSSSPANNDLLGTFVFKGKNDAAEETVYASFQTRANDVSDGTEDGNMFFKVMTNGTLEDRLALKGANPTTFQTQPVRLDSVDLQFRNNSKTLTLTTDTLTDSKTITLPNDTGTVALTTTTDALETRRAANIAGAVSTITTSDLTASRALVSGSGGKVEVSAVTSTELGYLDGVSSAIQTQLNAKQATITGAATTIDDTDLTASRALVSDGSGKVAVSAITSTELAFLDGITQNINSNLEALAAGIAGASTTFPTGDYGILDAANSSTDAFAIAIAGLTQFDMSTDPIGSLATEDLGALS